MNLGSISTADLLKVWAILLKYNPYHDEQGRFAESPSGGTFPADIHELPKGLDNTKLAEYLSRLPQDTVIHMYHGTTAAAAQQVVGSMHLKPDDLHSVGLAANYGTAREYGKYHTGYGAATKRARTITISSGGKKRDDALNPIVARVRQQLIALVAEHSNRNKYSEDQARNDHGEWTSSAVTKVSGLAFADAARAILRQGYAAAYLAGKKVAAGAATAPPAAKARRTKPAPETVTPPDEYDRYADDYDWYGDLDDDGQDAVDDSSGGLNDRLLGLGALLLGGAVSAAMLDAWMGTYAAGLNPLFEDGFQAGVEGLGQIQQAEWHSENDSATCEDCLNLNGMTWVGDEIDAAMPHPGDSEFGGRTACGPNCFVAGTLVSGRFVSGMRSRYVGELVELRTVRGHRLTVTPNHPIATPAGFIPADSLREGDYVLSQSVAVEAADGLNMEDGPAVVEQVLEALENRPSAWFGSWKPRSVDLHGDAANVEGDVYVVGTDRKLLRHGDAASVEGLRQFSLVSSDMGVGSALSESPMGGMVGGDRMPGRGSPSRSEQIAGGLVAKSPSREHSLTAIANGDAVPPQDGVDGGAWHLVGISEYLPRDASGVEAADDPIRQSVGAPLAMNPDGAYAVGCAAKVDARLSEPAGNSINADAEFISDLTRRFPGLVAPDEVVEVRRWWNAATHVYDLGTDGGWLLAGGILAGNCRCSLDYEVVPADQATYSWGGYDDSDSGDVEAMSTADLLKVWAITSQSDIADMPTSHLLTLRSILKYSEDEERDYHGRWTSGGGGIDTPAETSGNIFLDPWHGQEGDAAATEREGSRDLKVGDKVVSSDGRVGTISHLGGPHGDDPAVLSVRYGQDYETTVLSDIHLADTWETPKGWMAGGVINSDPVPPSLTAGPLMAREVMTKSDDSGRNYQIMYPPGMNPNDPQVVRLRSELTDSVKYNVAMEQDTGIKNAWSGRLILGTGSQDGQESVAAVKAWGCDIRLASGWQANIIAGTYHSSEAANNNDEQLTLTHELAHGISNTVNGPDEKDDYMVSPGWEEGVAEGYARAFTDAQVLGPDTHTSFFQQGSYQNWVDGLDTARATVAMYTNTTGFMNPTASDRLAFYRTLLTTPLNGRSSMVSTMLEPTGHAGIALVGTPLGSNAWAFVENLHPFGIGKTATPDKVPTPEESRALMPKVAAHLAEHPEDWNTVGREAEMLWLIATALDKSVKPAAKA